MSFHQYYKRKFSAKSRLYFPVLISIVLSVTLITLFSVNSVRQSADASVRRNLTSQVQTIYSMFEREHDLKLDKVKSDLKIANRLFYQKNLSYSKDQFEITAVNQLTGNGTTAKIFRWMIDGNDVWTDTTFVDEIYSLVGGTSTIFQKIDSGYVRISTNVRKSDGSRAVGTFIPNESEVIQTIEKGETYIGRAFVVNDWYITAYEPIVVDGEISGILYVGDKEKDVDELRDKLTGLKIGQNGYPLVLDESGRFIIHPTAKKEPWIKDSVISRILDTKSGIQSFVSQDDKREMVIAYDYFDKFNWIIAAALPLKDETTSLVRNVIINSIIIGLLIIVAFSVFIYFVTAENVRNFLSQLEYSSKKLKSAEKALEQSEHHFRTLFNNSSDDIFVIDFDGRFLEVNQVACDSLGYTREEFLEMNVREIKPETLKAQVDSNITMIKRFGQHRYETENQGRDGKVIPVEMKSRVIEYKGEQVILSIARDISERKEVEDRILTTIIQTEENERKRFAADLHDDLGPILSTIKLYTDLLKKKTNKNINNEEAIRNIEELVDMSIQSTRTISRNIRPNILQDFGLAAAINDFCNYIKKSESLNIEVNTSLYSIQKRGIEESVLYQAVKELINNTLKHAEAKNIKIELKSFENQVILYYRDDGKGFEMGEVLKTNTGLGLTNIVNKIKSVKGTVDINTDPGRGMFLIASLKLKSSEKENGNS